MCYGVYFSDEVFPNHLEIPFRTLHRRSSLSSTLDRYATPIPHKRRGSLGPWVASSPDWSITADGLERHFHTGNSLSGEHHSFPLTDNATLLLYEPTRINIIAYYSYRSYSINKLSVQNLLNNVVILGGGGG